MIQFTDIILISLFIEAIVNALKPIWTSGEGGLTVSEYVSMGMGVLLAVTCKINMLSYVVEMTYPVWVEYVFYALTGIAIGRGTNFLYDLWDKLKGFQGGKAMKAPALEEEEADVEITHWSLEQLKGFSKMNGVNTDGCVTREDYIDAIERHFLKLDNEHSEESGAK